MFFFSSRRRHTRFDCDWSSDVCSSDLISSCELALRKPRSEAELREVLASNLEDLRRMAGIVADMLFLSQADRGQGARLAPRSEEHTSELQSQSNLVCRLLLEKKKKKNNMRHTLTWSSCRARLGSSH